MIQANEKGLSYYEKLNLNCVNIKQLHECLLFSGPCVQFTFLKYTTVLFAQSLAAKRSFNLQIGHRKTAL